MEGLLLNKTQNYRILRGDCKLNTPTLKTHISKDILKRIKTKHFGGKSGQHLNLNFKK